MVTSFFDVQRIRRSRLRMNGRKQRKCCAVSRLGDSDALDSCRRVRHVGMVARCGSRPFYDIAVRDVVLSIAACTLANLTEARDTARNSQTPKSRLTSEPRRPVAAA
jgi:hypothetical protein